MLCFAVTRTAAAKPCVELELDAPEGCPSGTTIEQAVMGLVRTVPSEPLRARAVVARDGERFTVLLVTPAGERRFDGETCEAAADALTVILALAVDPNASTPEEARAAGDARASSPSPPNAPVAVAAPKAEAPPPAPPPSREEERQRALAVGGSLLFFVDTGVLPKPSAGAAGLLRLSDGGVSLEIGGRLLMPRSTTLEADPEAGGTFRFAAGELDGCVRLSEPFHGCVGFELGTLSGEGFGVDVPETGMTTWFALTAGAVARGRIAGAFGLEGRLGVAVPTERERFGLEGLGELHQPDAVTLRGGRGLAFH
jgi:hypothetical protein